MQTRWTYLLAGAFTFFVCYFRAFLFPNIPFLAWGDALGYATKGARILDGEWPYRDFVDFVTPGIDLTYALLFHWFGITLGIPDLLICVLAVLVALWMTWCARRLMPENFAVLPALLFVGLLLAGSFDPTHHWFSTLFAMAAVTALFNGLSTRRIFLAGLFCALTASFTQSTGAALLLALLAHLWWKGRLNRAQGRTYLRFALLLCVVAFVVFAAINVPFVLAAGPRLWFADVIVFSLRYFGTVSANNWHGTVVEFSQKTGVLRWLCMPFLYVVIPSAYLWTFAELLRRRIQDDRFFLLAAVGTMMLLAVATGPSMRRVSCAGPPAMILFVWLLSRHASFGNSLAQILAVVSAIVAVAQAANLQWHYHRSLHLPVGQVAILDPGNAEVYQWMLGHTHPGQWYFGMPPYTLPLALKNPTPIESPAPGEYGRPEQIAAAIAELERTQTPMLLMRPVFYTPQRERDHLQPFQNYLFAHYRRTKSFTTGDEVWVRIER